MKMLRSLLGLLVVFGAVYVAWMIVPPYFNNYQLEEAMDDAARGLYVNYSRPESEFREQVLKEARSMYIPLTEENLHIERGPNDYYVWGDYTVHVNLPLYPLELKFHPASKSQKRRM
jgi:hypothetical protein